MRSKPMTRKNPMRTILKQPLARDQAAAWFLGQAGYILRGGGVSLTIDPYLSDCAAKVVPECARLLPVPIHPAQLDVDIYIVTHDHLDHLDPETIAAYRHKDRTAFVAPRLACRKLRALGVPARNVHSLDSGDRLLVKGVEITGIYAVPSEPAVIDTTGYLIAFANGRSFYHTSDTAYSDVLLAAAPRAEVLACCINGKWGNLDAMEAAHLAARIKPRYALPNHYDLMAINSENPQTFAVFTKNQAPEVAVKILQILQPFIWSAVE